MYAMTNNLMQQQDETALSDDENPMLDAGRVEGEGLQTLASGTDGGSGETVKPGDVDAFWLQRKLNKHYNDADVSQVQISIAFRQIVGLVT